MHAGIDVGLRFDAKARNPSIPWASAQGERDHFGVRDETRGRPPPSRAPRRRVSSL